MATAKFDIVCKASINNAVLFTYFSDLVPRAGEVIRMREREIISSRTVVRQFSVLEVTHEVVLQNMSAPELPNKNGELIPQEVYLTLEEFEEGD